MTDATTPAPATRKITVRNFIDAPKLKADLSYSINNLDDAFQAHAGLVAHYAELAAYSSKQVADLELVIEAAESKVYRKMLDDAVAEEKKPPSDAALTRFLAGNDYIIGLKRALNEAKQVEKIARGALDAIKDKKDMLVQAGSKSREELKGELRMREATGRDDALTNAKERFSQRVGA